MDAEQQNQGNALVIPLTELFGDSETVEGPRALTRLVRDARRCRAVIEVAGPDGADAEIPVYRVIAWLARHARIGSA